MTVRWIGILWLLSILAAACSGADSTSGEPIFGTEDTTCRSVRLTNDLHDASLFAGAVDCLLAEVQAGRPVTVDIALATVEGDPVYNRFAFDGEQFLIVEDSRADDFGRGAVQARSCAGIEATNRLPEGLDCETVDHRGFPEATADR